jgi:DNA repair photolyase
VIVRLPNEIRELFQDWLQQHEPLKAQRVMNAIRALRGGRDYDSAFFRRQRGTGVFADLIRKRFESVCGRLGLNKDREILNTDLFKPPGRADGQMDMF